MDRGRTRSRNRWTDDRPAAKVHNLPTMITGCVTAEQLEAYSVNFRIQEITEKLTSNNVVPRDRSPSPPPQYDQDGVRINTAEFRYRTRLEQERHQLFDKALRLIPKFKAPLDYKPPRKTQEKIYIPANDYPEVNFIGLLIGPRGKTLQRMESESGARIAIRGKGSVKEGKGRLNENLPHVQSLNEDLHCLIVADTEEKINKAVELVNQVIETAASIPESQNTLKNSQLRELAAMNGTLRDFENQPCQNCGELGHRKSECPRRRNFTASVTCHICGAQGHFARDCKERRNRPGPNNNRNAAEREYEALMSEIGGGTPFSSGANSTPLAIGNSQSSNVSQPSATPWHSSENNGGPAPWKNGGTSSHSAQFAGPGHSTSSSMPMTMAGTNSTGYGAGEGNGAVRAGTTIQASGPPGASIPGVPGIPGAPGVPGFPGSSIPGAPPGLSVPGFGQTDAPPSNAPPPPPPANGFFHRPPTTESPAGLAPLGPPPSGPPPARPPPDGPPPSAPPGAPPSIAPGAPPPPSGPPPGSSAS